MQQPPAPPNPLTEIAAFVIAGLLIIAGAFLLYAQRIDLAGATSIFLLAVGILAANIALKAPSPTQQAQLQAIVSQVMSVIPGLVARLQQSTPTPQVTVHNYIPPTATVPAAIPTQPVPAVPIVAATQPAPVQITPNNAAANTWNAINQPLPAQVPQQPFPPSVPFPERFTQQPPAVSGQ